MKQDHIIQKVFVEITVNHKEKAFSIKEDISSFLSMDVFPEIEKYINDLKYKWGDQTLQIPRLTLNLDVKSSSLNTELKYNIAKAFKEELSEITQSAIEHSDPETEHDIKAYLIDNEEKMVQTFIHFLEKGTMPWWNSDKKNINLLEPTVFDVLILADTFPKKIISVLSKPNVQDRIIHQLSDEQIAQVCLAVLENKELKINLKTEIIHLISKLSFADRILIWHLILCVISEFLTSSSTGNLQEYLLRQIVKTEAAKPSLVKNNDKNWKTVAKIFPFIQETDILQHIKNNTADPDHITATKAKVHPENPDPAIDPVEQARTFIESIDQEDDVPVYEDEKTEKRENGIYVQNAGLILIHPFLKTFFEHCDLLDPKTQQLTDPELCAHLLHYIATGSIHAPEYEMTFEKFLCNIPLEQPVNRHIKLSRKHKTEAKNVIESVQHNWSPMKKSSAALLQNEFFQRSGKLEISNHDYILTVERKTQDILLDRLSWGIGLVKLPWQKKFIFINW